jgi:hypothetical protein
MNKARLFPLALPPRAVASLLLTSLYVNLDIMIHGEVVECANKGILT